jgi:hypothetical protein
VSTDGWRNFPIALTDPDFGEQTAQTCDMACFRQLGGDSPHPSHLWRLPRMVSNKPSGRKLAMRMRLLFRSCLTASCLSAVSLIAFWNTGLALTTDHYCVAFFTVPFTDKVFWLPRWWQQVSMVVWAASTLVALTLLIPLLVLRRRIRRLQT